MTNNTYIMIFLYNLFLSGLMLSLICSLGVIFFMYSSRYNRTNMSSQSHNLVRSLGYCK